MYYYDFLDKFKHDYDAGVILLADRGYRFITEDVESFGIKIFIPAIQQERLNLGDADSQVILLEKSLKLFLLYKVNVQSDSQPSQNQPDQNQPGQNQPSQNQQSQSASQGFFSATQQSLSENSPRPISSQSRRRPRPRPRTKSDSRAQSQSQSQSQPNSRKSQLEKYWDSKPLSCLDANISRIISARRHIIENVNGHLKKWLRFYHVVTLQRMRSGFALAGIKLILAILNRRHLEEGHMIMDQNPNSYLPTLERALLFQTRHEKLSNGTENLFWPIMEDYFSEFFDLRLSGPWEKINMTSQDDLDFPEVSFDDNVVQVYESLQPNHIWFFCLGNYGLKRACSYLNSVEYERDFFDCQKLKIDSDLYQIISNRFLTSAFNVVRFRVPSIHKPTSINSNGYHGVIVYRSIDCYDQDDPSKFKLKGNIPVIDIDKKDYYFSNSILGHWCSCKTGMRTIGSCTHVISALVGFGRPSNYSKPRFRVLNPNSFPAL